MSTPCKHKYVFIRQFTDTDGGNYRPTITYYDQFFCEKCLEYKRVEVAQSTANGFDSGYTKRLTR